jgi:hypothetical protein
VVDVVPPLGTQFIAVPATQVNLIVNAVEGKRTVPSAAPSSMSSMNGVWIFWACRHFAACIVLARLLDVR